MSNLYPDPLTPPDCNLQNFKFMPVDVDRVLNSDTWQLATDTEKVAAITLWFKSWRQVPAASLPDNDRILGNLAGAKNWGRVKEQAMRGWRLCNDGRWYHPVVAEKALEAWIEKLIAQATGGAGNAKRWGVEFDASSMLAKLQDAAQRLQTLAPASETLRKKAVVQALAGIAPGIAAGSAPDSRTPSGGESGPESGRGRNRQGQGQGQGIGEDFSGGAALPPAPPPPATPQPTKAPKAKTSKPAKAEGPTVATWAAYAAAYEARHGAVPVRNATVNGQLAQFVARIGAEEAPAVAAFFVDHNNPLYVRALHPVALLLKDAEGLRTQWATGRHVTDRPAPLSARAQRVADHFPAVAERRGPPPRTIDAQEVSDVEPRTAIPR